MEGEDEEVAEILEWMGKSIYSWDNISMANYQLTMIIVVKYV